MSKSTGSYYTPEKLATFVWEHAFKRVHHNSSLSILEPSCGNGIFLQTIAKCDSNVDLFVDAIEINRNALETTQKALAQKNGCFNATFLHKDFLEIKLSQKYDLVIGNPPYIGRKLLSESQKELCKQIHERGNLDSKGVHNIWTAFLIKAASLLRPEGVLAFVLPGELLQVSYAQKIQQFLQKNFEFIEILTFRELVFSALGQDVVVIFAYKGGSTSGLGYTQVYNADSLNNTISFPQRKPKATQRKSKWSNFVLSDSDLDFLSDIEQGVSKVSDYCGSTPGIVTAANKYFIVNEKMADAYGLKPYCEPILQKSEFVEQVVSINSDSFEELRAKNKPCYLINLGTLEKDILPSSVQNYIEMGVDRGLPKGYKCSRRQPWYNIPGVWVPEGVIFKRCHWYPKLLKNEAQVLFTDSAYRIRPYEGFDIDSLIYSFYNSLTLVFCELDGRYYGGGVLELTPREFQNLPIPYQSITADQFLEFKEEFENRISKFQFLRSNDQALLTDIGLTPSEINKLRQIHQKLLLYRLKAKSPKEVLNGTQPITTSEIAASTVAGPQSFR